MTVVAISQSNYLPWKGYFQLISRADIFVFYDTVDFTKRDWLSHDLSQLESLSTEIHLAQKSCFYFANHVW